MMRWEERLFGTTRSRIVLLFRRARRTVDELASALGLTDNAVRGHLAALERDGLIRPNGSRPSGGKPATVYELTPEAESFFPRAYGLVLTRLVDVLQERQSTEQTLALLREAGRRVASDYPAPSGDRQTRLQRAADLLSSLGGLAEVEKGENGRLRLRGYSCPLGAVIREHPEACGLAEALITEATGMRVRERCVRERGEPPRCLFEVDDEADSVPDTNRVAHG
jgi:predicted ArsR family transcriptional regulator